MCNPGTEICDNGLDDNGDGYVDCAEEDCVDVAACIAEQCDNGLDDNGDGTVDCADPSCFTDGNCVSGSCSALSSVVCSPGSTSFTVSDVTSGAGSLDYYSCGVAELGPEYIFSVESTTADGVSLTLSHGAGVNLDLLVLSGGGAAICEATACSGVGSSSGSPETLYFDAQPGETYFVVVDGAGALDAGAFSVDVDCGLPPLVEQCENGTDDDGDGAIDCLDSDCALSAACTPAENCLDNLDNDGDGDIDCSDDDCTFTAPNCAVESCTGGVDEDGDGDTDCADTDCLGDPSCP